MMELIEELLDYAKRSGAEEADSVLVNSSSYSWEQRMRRPEGLEHSVGKKIGLRVIIDNRQAMVSSSDFSSSSLKSLASMASTMARYVPKDKNVGIALAEQLAKEIKKFDSFCSEDVAISCLQNWADAAESEALDNKLITNSEGASASFSRSLVYAGATNGFRYENQHTSCSVAVSCLAMGADGMESDYDFSYAVYPEDLKSSKQIGKEAADRTIKKLNPKKIKTCKVPVVFDKRVSSSLLGHFASAILGTAIVRKTSMLYDCLGKEVFSPSINIVDNPHMQRGFASKSVDGEGLATSVQKIISKGILQSYFLDLHSSRYLNLSPTAHASRTIGSAPSPSSSNLYIEAGKVSVAELISDIKQGVLVTDLIGMGVNTITGDYSRGAKGFWIENGEITYPVSEITVAGNLLDMYKNCLVASDLEFLGSMNSPTLRVDSMTVAGN